MRTFAMTPAGYVQDIRRKGDVDELTQILDWRTGLIVSYLYLYKFIKCSTLIKYTVTTTTI